MFCTDDEFPHCKSLCCCCAKDITNARIYENLVPENNTKWMAASVNNGKWDADDELIQI